jgi:hypothetical protein
MLWSSWLGAPGLRSPRPRWSSYSPHSMGWGNTKFAFTDRVQMTSYCSSWPTKRRIGFSMPTHWWMPPSRYFSIAGVTSCERGLPPPLRFKVRLSISNLPAHIWSTDSIQEIIGSSCLVFEVTPCSTSKSDMSKFMVVAWSLNANLILAEVGCVIPEPTPLFVDR